MVVGALIDGEAGTAAASRFGVGIAHCEVAAHQFVRIIELRTCQQVETGRIDQHLGAAELNKQVIFLRRLIQFKAILKPAAAASQDRDAQRSLSAIGGDNFGYPGRSPLVRPNCSIAR